MGGKPGYVTVIASKLATQSGPMPVCPGLFLELLGETATMGFSRLWAHKPFLFRFNWKEPYNLQTSLMTHVSQYTDTGENQASLAGQQQPFALLQAHTGRGRARSPAKPP